MSSILTSAEVNIEEQTSLAHLDEPNSNDGLNQTAPAIQPTNNVNTDIVPENITQSQDGLQAASGTVGGETQKEHPCGTWQPPVHDEHPEGDAIRRQVTMYLSHRKGSN